MPDEHIRMLYEAVFDRYSDGTDPEDVSRTVEKNFDAFLKIGIDPNQLLVMLNPRVAMEKIDTVDGADVDFIAGHFAKTKSPALLKDYYRKFKERINEDTFNHCREDWINALREEAKNWTAEKCLARFKTLWCLPHRELAELIFEKCKYADAADCAEIIESKGIFDLLCKVALRHNRQSDFLRLVFAFRWENSHCFYEEALALGKTLAGRGFNKQEILKKIIDQCTIDILSEDIGTLFKENGFGLDTISQEDLWSAMRKNDDISYFIREGNLEEYVEVIGLDAFAKFLSFADVNDVDFWYFDKVRDHDDAKIEEIVETYLLENTPDIGSYLAFTALERLYHRDPEKAKAVVAKRRKEFNEFFDTIRTSEEYDDEEREFIKNFQ